MMKVLCYIIFCFRWSDALKISANLYEETQSSDITKPNKINAIQWKASIPFWWDVLYNLNTQQQKVGRHIGDLFYDATKQLEKGSSPSRRRRRKTASSSEGGATSDEDTVSSTTAITTITPVTTGWYAAAFGLDCNARCAAVSLTCDSTKIQELTTLVENTQMSLTGTGGESWICEISHSRPSDTFSSLLANRANRLWTEGTNSDYAYYCNSGVAPTCMDQSAGFIALCYCNVDDATVVTITDTPTTTEGGATSDEDTMSSTAAITTTTPITSTTPTLALVYTCENDDSSRLGLPDYQVSRDLVAGDIISNGACTTWEYIYNDNSKQTKFLKTTCNADGTITNVYHSESSCAANSAYYFYFTSLSSTPSSFVSECLDYTFTVAVGHSVSTYNVKFRSNVAWCVE